MLIINDKEHPQPLTDEEFEKIWAVCKANDERLLAEWNELSEEEKKRKLSKYDPAFIERISDDIV